MAYERNLVLVHTARFQARSDFEAIQRPLTDRAPDIEVFIVDNLALNSVTRRHAERRPVLVFSPVPLGRFRPRRGVVRAGELIPKVTQIARLKAAGLSVPATVVMAPGIRLDANAWGPFVVVKPDTGSGGKGVRLRRTEDVSDEAQTAVPGGHCLLAQQFIYTGAIPTSHRVLTVFGRVVYSAVSRMVTAQPIDLASEEAVDAPIASNLEETVARSAAGEAGYELNFDGDVIALARDAARAFPAIPVLGIDIVREHETGKLFVLEVNPGGLTWHISSDYGRGLQRKYALDLAAQFGALDVIADALIEATRREAA